MSSERDASECHKGLVAMPCPSGLVDSMEMPLVTKAFFFAYCLSTLPTLVILPMTLSSVLSHLLFLP